MKKKILFRFVQSLCLFVFFVMVAKVISVSASSADITISASKSECKKGEYLDIYIDIEADVLPGDFEGYLLYKENILEYVSGPEIVTGGDGVLKISDSVFDPVRNSRRYSLRFKAVSTGECEITLRDTPELYEFEEGYLMSVSVSGFTLNVTADTEVASDGRLAVLKISPGKLEPEFSPDIKEYRTSVPGEIEKLTVSAAAMDLDSKTEVRGNEDLEYGNNRIEVTVTAANGEKVKYTIICERQGILSENPDTGNNSGSDPDDNSGTGTGANDEIGGEKAPSDSLRVPYGIKADESGDEIRITVGNGFTVVPFDENIEIPEGYRKTSLMIDGVSIPVYVPEDIDGYILMMLRGMNGETGLYCYDRTEKTLQRYKDKQEKKTNVMTDSIEALELAASYEKSLNTLTLIIAVLSALSMALLIIVIRLALKGRNDGLDD